MYYLDKAVPGTGKRLTRSCGMADGLDWRTRSRSWQEFARRWHLFSRKQVSGGIPALDVSVWEMCEIFETSDFFLLNRFCSVVTIYGLNRLYWKLFLEPHPISIPNIGLFWLHAVKRVLLSPHTHRHTPRNDHSFRRRLSLCLFSMGGLHRCARYLSIPLRRHRSWWARRLAPSLRQPGPDVYDP